MFRLRNQDQAKEGVVMQKNQIPLSLREYARNNGTKGKCGKNVLKKILCYSYFIRKSINYFCALICASARLAIAICGFHGFVSKERKLLSAFFAPAASPISKSIMPKS